MTSFRQAARALARRRTFTLMTAITLAIGIAMVTTTFSVVSGVLLRPPPYPGAGGPVTAFEASPAHRGRASLVAPGRLRAWRPLPPTFPAHPGGRAEDGPPTGAALTAQAR